MDFGEFNNAIADAESTIRRADRAVERLGSLMINRLRLLSVYTLRRLKRELQDFNSTTGEWKS